MTAWNTNMDEAPRDGTRLLLAWGDDVVIGDWLDNSGTRFPWAGWHREGMRATHGKPTAWMPLPPPPDGTEGE